MKRYIFALGLALLAGTGAGLAQAAENNTSRPGVRSVGSAGPVALAAAPITGNFAVVNGNGTLARGKGVLRTTKLGGTVGLFEVLFNSAITRCAFAATIGSGAFVGNSPPGEVAVVGLIGTTNGVFVQTFNSAGAPADRAFHLVVIC